MVPGGREVGPLHDLREAADVDVGVVDHRVHRGDDLTEVVRRDVRRHADRDALRAVQEQVRIARREDGRLAARLVVVGDEIDRVGVDVAQHLGRHARKTALRVAHRARRVTVDRAEVTLPLDERVAHRERLCEPGQGVVDRRVAVGVVVAHHVADDARRLPGGAVRLQAGLVHGVEHPAVDGLQAVAHVRQGARDDHAHRVVEEAGANLGL